MSVATSRVAHSCDDALGLSQLEPSAELAIEMTPPTRRAIVFAPSDDELLASSDPEAFGVFYARHADAVQRYFARRTGDAELAADLTSETFAAALLARRRFVPGGPPAAAWLYTIAARRLVDHRRRAVTEQRIRDIVLNDAREAARDDEGITTVLRGRVSVAILSQLPADQRSAVGAHVLVGSGYAEISQAAGISAAAARQRVSRGLAALRTVMRAYQVADELAAQSRRYAHGGGHGKPLDTLAPREALDCSSFSSLVLKRAGLFEPERAWTSGRLTGWGDPGEGRCMTVWANEEHVWLEFRLGDQRTERFDVAARGTRRADAAGPPASDAIPRHAPGA